MRFHPIALAALLAAGCTAQNDAAPPLADSPADPEVSLPTASDEPALQSTGTVPAQFQGDYAADAAACTAPGHVTRLAIGASRIGFHESTGAVTAVEHDGNQVDITARLTGEGETREATYSYRLSDDGRTLTDVQHGMVRQRCD